MLASETMTLRAGSRCCCTRNAAASTLNRLIDHIDHICELAGNTNHIGIGSDLDGAFGKEQSPTDIETIADLQKFPNLLSQRGYKDADIQKFMQGNWLGFLRHHWRNS